MHSRGDIVFDDYFSEQWFEAIDLTIPEPGGILLLGSGALTAIGAMRRRLQK
jgi:hypothetical protein